jgi:hypothetical protein
MKKVYPLTIDEKAYEALKALASLKNITMKDALRQAIGLFLADNITLFDLTPKENATDENTSGDKQS